MVVSQLNMGIMKPSHHKAKYCEKSGKYCYPSEAKAIRAVNRYEDIKRSYLCGSCGFWHTTSWETYYSKGTMENPPIQKKVTEKDVKKRLEQLLKKHS